MRLHLHVGHGKTGSSFLQSWLSINAMALQERAGLLYPHRCSFSGRSDPRAKQSQFSMGNGYVLDPLLDPCCSPYRARRWSRRLFRHHGVTAKALNGVVFSCEPWARSLPAQLKHLLSLSELLGFEGVELWLLVRDPLDHAISVYGQMVKRHGFSGDLEDWLEIYDFPKALLNFLEIVESHVGNISLKVDHYGRNKSSLVDLLKSWLSLPSDICYKEPKSAFVNRSLTLQELNLMRHLNARDPAVACLVGERLVDQLPAIRSEVLFPSSLIEQRFIARWQNTVNQINSLLPASAFLNLCRLSEVSFSKAEDSVPSDESMIVLSCDQIDCILDIFLPGQNPLL